MRKILLFLSVLLLYPTVSFSKVTGTRTFNMLSRVTTITFYRDGKEIAKQKIDGNGVIFESTGTIPDGVVKEYAKDGTLLYENSYQDGKLNGPSKAYYKNGSLAGEWTFKNNKLEGTGKQYYESGELQYLDTYKDDKLIKRKYYDRQGKLIEEKNMTIDKKKSEKPEKNSVK